MKKGWLIAGAVVGCLSGASLGACGSGGSGTTTTAGTGGSSSPSSATSTTTTTTTTTTSTTTSTTGTGGSTTTSTTGTGGNSGTGGGGTCSKVTMLHPPNLEAGAGTIYCPFSGVDGGKAEYCTPLTEHCCETPAGSPTPSGCHPTATACGATDTDWQCEDPVTDCASGMDCCATSKPGKTSSIGLGAPGCGNFAHQMIGTACMAAGSCPGIKMCTSDAECGAGKTCTPFGKAGNQVGGCM